MQGVMEQDLLSLLRLRNVHILADVRYAIWENGGSLSVISKRDDLEQRMLEDLPLSARAPS